MAHEESNGARTEMRGEILLVDDSASSLAYLSTLLSRAGYLIREAPTGELALMTLQVRLPELILLDVRMPGLDGFEVCRRIKADAATRDLPVIFLSAQDETPDKVLGLKVGAVDFISKTFEPEEMLARIDTHITLARVKKALESERANLENRVRERTEALRQGRSLLQAVIDCGPDWINASDKSGRWLLVNRNMANALGDADAGKMLDQLDVSPAHHADEERVFSGEVIYDANEKLVLPSGETRSFETYKTPLRDTDGEIYGVLYYRRDITQRIRIEAENRTLEKALWQAKKMEAVGQLAGGIAHDFNHLLSLILGYAQFARTALATGKTEKLADYLSEIIQAGSDGQAVVSQLLAFSRAEEVATESIDIAPVIAGMLDALRQSIGPCIALAAAIAADLPPVCIKPSQVRQIVSNLVLNARDALDGQGSIELHVHRQPADGPRLCTSCHRRFQGAYVQLSVKDNGSGIADHVMEQIFDPFFTTKDIGKGVGLGLPMVHGIVHAAGGHIEVNSAPGNGSEFTLWLPIGENSRILPS